MITYHTKKGKSLLTIFRPQLFNNFYVWIQVNLFQKHLFLHQLTPNMTKDCSLIYYLVQYMKTTSSEHVVYINCFCFRFDIQNNLCTQDVNEKKYN